jgi:hypothetical protein
MGEVESLRVRQRGDQTRGRIMVTAVKQVRKKARKAPKYQVVATMSDGVKILRAKAKPTHFTAREIRATIREVLRDSAAKK